MQWLVGRWISTGGSVCGMWTTARIIPRRRWRDVASRTGASTSATIAATAATDSVPIVVAHLVPCVTRPIRGPVYDRFVMTTTCFGKGGRWTTALLADTIQFHSTSCSGWWSSNDSNGRWFHFVWLSVLVVLFTPSSTCFYYNVSGPFRRRFFVIGIHSLTHAHCERLDGESTLQLPRVFAREKYCFCFLSFFR